MTVEKTEKDIASLVGQVSSGEIKLPEIQRGYVWKPTQIAKLVESLYRGYPRSGVPTYSSQTPSKPRSRPSSKPPPSAPADSRSSQASRSAATASR